MIPIRFSYNQTISNPFINWVILQQQNKTCKRNTLYRNVNNKNNDNDQHKEVQILSITK